jgi:hypothetical protein
MRDYKDLQKDIVRHGMRATAPFDHALHDQAQRTAGHIDLKAVGDEYNRLIDAKYERLLRPRSLWSRIFG